MAFFDDIMSGIGAVGDVMQKPRQWAWSQLGLPESGTEVLSQKLGMDPNSMLTQGLGFALEEFGDPLSWTPFAIGKAAKWLGRGADVARAGRVGATADAAAPHLAKQWAAGAADEVPGTVSRFLGAPESASPVARFMGGESGALRLPGAPSVDRGLAGGQALRSGRERFSVFKDVEPLDDFQTDQLEAMIQSGQAMDKGHVGVMFREPGHNLGYAGRVASIAPETMLDPDTGRLIAKTPIDKFGDVMDSAIATYDPKLRGIGGAYLPGQRTALIMSGAPAGTLRHELTHGLTRSAAETGNYEGLGLVPKISAMLQRGPYSQAQGILRAGGSVDDSLGALKNFRYGLGSLTDELGAHMAETRGLPGQLGQGANFLFAGPNELLARSPLGSSLYSPETLKNLLAQAANRAGYAKDFAAYSPAAGRLYRGLQYTPYGLGLAGAAGTGTLLGSLMGE